MSPNSSIGSNLNSTNNLVNRKNSIEVVNDYQEINRYNTIIEGEDKAIIPQSAFSCFSICG